MIIDAWKTILSFFKGFPFSGEHVRFPGCIFFSENAMSDDRGDVSFLEKMTFSLMIPIGGRCRLGYLDYLSNLQVTWE